MTDRESALTPQPPAPADPDAPAGGHAARAVRPPDPSAPTAPGCDATDEGVGRAAARVRHARPDDLPHVARLASEHAAYEEAAAPPAGLAGRLETLLFGTAAPRLRCFVAELDDGEIIGYASCAPELSTWDGAEYLHMDCLYLREGHRGSGVGQKLVEAVLAEARARGLREVQWQTPPWNTGAIRFYERLGAQAQDKRRFSLPTA